MEYIVSARKYRPMTFDSVVGQAALTTTLKNAVKSGKLAHAYLFCGPRGVGKTTCARIFAKAINCLNPTPDGEACNECESCRAFNEQRSYNIFELDAASNNGVEQIKALMEQTRIPPQVGKYKVFIIDEVHMLSAAAFNAFLKTLEEPPAHVVFILATTEKHKILPTIISRCQIYDFERMTVQNTIDHLKMVAEKEGVAYEEEALALIAEKADGGMRDALSIFDQAASFCQGNITYAKVIEDLNALDADNYFRIVDLALDNKVPDIMVLLNGIIAKGFDGGNLVLGLAAHVRNVLMAKDEQTLGLLEVSQQQREKYKEQASRCPTPFLYKALKLANQCDINYRASSNKRLLVELTLIQVAQITQPADDVPSAGRSPKRLKSLFKHHVMSQSETAVQVAGAGQKPLARDKARTQQRNATPGTHPQAEGATPQQATEQQAKRPLKLRNVGVTFESLRRGPDRPGYLQEPEEPMHNEKADFTQDNLDMQWLAMCNRMPPQMQGMAARMKNMHPRITEFPHIEIVIDNQMLLNQISSIKGRIRATMMKELHNSDIDISLRLAEIQEMKPIKGKRQIFEELREAFPAIRQLQDDLQLELA